jgi:hypothetical protein
LKYGILCPRIEHNPWKSVEIRARKRLGRLSELAEQYESSINLKLNAAHVLAYSNAVKRT